MCPRNSDPQDSDQAMIDNPRVVEAEFDRAVSEFCGTALKRISASNAAAALSDYELAMRYGGETIVKMYQCGLRSQSLYFGALDGVYSSDVKRALHVCINRKGCDPLPGDELAQGDDRVTVAHEVLPVEQLRAELNPTNVPDFEGVASTT